MKKFTSKNYLLALFLALSTFSIKAQNLVLNPSFENTNITGCSSVEGFQTNLLNWDDTNSGADSCSSPDLFSSCNVVFGFQTPTYQPNNTLGYQHPHSGTRYAGLITYAPGLASNCTAVGNDQYREYIEGTLSTPMTAGQQYCVSFYVSLADNVAWTTNNIGVYFTNTQYDHNACPSNSLINFTPQLNYTCTPISDTSNWVQLQWNYTATGGETHFIIGNFFNNAATTVACNNPSAGFTNPYAYFYIDDVSITAGTCCNTDIKQQIPLCSTAPSVTLTTLGGFGAVCTPTITGVWSGAGITNAATGVFDPSVAGVGTHVVSYSLSCGYVATTSIVVNSCPLSVCKDASGNLTVSGSTSTYTWSTVTSYTDCSGCPGGNCIPFFCSGVATTSLTPYATNTPTVSAPSSYPVVVQDNIGNSYTVTSSAATPTCAVTNTCTPITVTTAASNSITCFGASTGSATVAVSPAGTYTTTWLPGGLTGASQSGLAAGIYTVTADAGGGCTGTTTVSITQATAISNTITVTNATCNLSNGSATVTTSGGAGAYTYTWNPIGGNAATASNLPAGVYTLNVTDANTCTTTATATVSTSATPTITIVATPYCTGDSTALTANGATTYTWSPATALSHTNTSSVTATPTATTIYTVTGTTGACSSTNTISVGPLTFTVNKVNLCMGDSATLIASNPNLTYSWTPSTGLNHTNNDTVKASPTVTTVYTITATYGSTCSLTVTDSVIVLTKPVITVLSPTVCSATSATITAAGALTYTWMPATGLSTSITSDTAYVNTPTTPGTFTVVGTAANGCKDTAVSTVTISNHLGIVSATPNFRCYGDYINLLAVGASTYTWTSNDPVNLNFNPSTGYSVVTNTANVGTYTIAIYGESHTGTFCVGHDTITLTINPTPTLTAVAPTATTICAGTSVNLTASSVAGPATVTNFTWAPPTGLSVTSVTNNAVGVTVATPPNSTLYSVTGYNQYGCTDTKTYSVTVIPIPTFNLNSAAYCLGGSATLTVTPTTADAATYTWTPAATLNTNTGTTVIANPNTTTVYTVNATTNVASCHSLPVTTTVTVHQPPASISVTPTSTTICSNTSTNLVASNNNLSYTWLPASAIGALSANTVTMTTNNPSVATVYTVSGVDAFGCASNTVTATVNVTLIASSASVAPVCKGQTIDLMGNTLAGASYSWNGPAGYTASGQTPTIPNSTAANNGTYTLTVTKAPGCIATSTVGVIVNALPIITVTPSQTACPNQSKTFAAVSPNPTLTYSWTPATGLDNANASTVTATTASTTVYSVVGTDGNGCMSTPASTTLHIAPISSAISATPPNGDFPLDVQFTNSSTGGIVYAWDYGNGTATYTTSSVSDVNTNTTYTAVGTYTVSMVAFNSFGCYLPSYLTIVVTEGFTMTIPNVFTPNGDGINDNFFVKSTGLATIEVTIFDRWGLKVWESSSASGMWNGGSSVEGTYFYIIKATSTKNETKEYKGNILLIK